MEDMHLEDEQKKRLGKTLYTELERHTPVGTAIPSGDVPITEGPQQEKKDNPKPVRTWSAKLLDFQTPAGNPSQASLPAQTAGADTGKTSRPTLSQDVQKPGIVTAAQPSPGDEIVSFASNIINKVKGWGITISPAEAKAMDAIVSVSEDKEAAADRFVEALGYSHMTGMSVEDVWNNLDDIIQYWTGNAFKVDDSTFMENATAGFKRQELTPLKEQFRDAALAGDTERMKRLEAQIDPIEKEIGGRGIPASAWQHVKAVVASNIGYNADIFMTTAGNQALMAIALRVMIGAAALNPFAAAAALAAAGTTAAVYGTAMAFKRTKEMQAADSFYELYHSTGDRHNTTSALILSELDGVITGLLETFVDGVTSRGIGMITGRRASSIGLSALADLGLRGGRSRLGKSLMDWTTGTLDEGFFNEFPERFFGEIRDSIYRSSVGLPADFDLKQTLKDSIGDAVDGLIVGAVYGGLSVPGSMAGRKAEAVELRRRANASMDKDSFMRATDKLKPEDVSQEDFDLAREEIFHASRTQAADVSAKLSARDKASFAGLAESAGVTYDATGVGEDKDGRKVVVFGNADTLRDAYDSLRRLGLSADIDDKEERAVIRFAQRTENGNTAYQELVLTTNQGEVQGEMHAPKDFFEDYVADLELQRPLFIGTLDRDSALTAQEIRSVREKLREKYNITGRKNKAAAQAYITASSILHVPTSTIVDKLHIVFEGDEAKEAVLRESGEAPGQDANGWMTRDEGAGTFTIHLTKTATPATLFHETAHIVRALASADQLADVERVYGITDHEKGWNRQHDETFAEDFIKYLRTQQAPTSKIKYLFSQIKRLLSFITSGRYSHELSEETARAFDRLWTGQSDPAEVLRKLEPGNGSNVESANAASDETGTGWEPPPKALLELADEGDDGPLFELSDPTYMKRHDIMADAFSGDEEKIQELADRIGIVRSDSLGMGGKRIARYMQKLAQERGLNMQDFDDPNVRKVYMDTYYQELLDRERLMGDSASPVGWYTRKVNQAFEYYSDIFPEFKYSEEARLAMTFALAVTSQGHKVSDNGVTLAPKMYRYFKEHGLFPTKKEEVGAGAAWNDPRWPAMSKNFEKINKMIKEQGLDLIQIDRLFAQKMEVKTIEQLGYVVSGTHAKDEYLFAGIMGPKIGGGFYSNLRGRGEEPTLDMWMHRALARLSGGTYDFDNDEVTEREDSDQFSAAERAFMFGLMKDLAALYNKNRKKGEEFGSKGMSVSDVQAVMWYNEKDLYDKLMPFAHVETGDDYASAAADFVVKTRLASDETYQKLKGKKKEAYYRDALQRYIQGHATAADGGQILASDVSYGRGSGQDRNGQADVRLQGDNGEDNAAQEIVAGNREGEEGLPGGRLGARFSFSPRYAEILSGRRFNRNRYEGWNVSGDGREGSQDGRPLRGRYDVKASPSKNSKLDVTYTAKWTPSVDYRQDVALYSVFRVIFPRKSFLKLEPTLKNAKAFRQALVNAKRTQGANQWRLSAYKVEDYLHMDTFLSEDGTFGFALKDGDIVSVFANSKEAKGATYNIVPLAITMGGDRLDCFDGPLPANYSRFGFRPVSRVKFDINALDKNTREHWNVDTMGTPDVVFMVFDPVLANENWNYDIKVSKEDIESLPYSSYDDAVRIQSEEAAKIRDMYHQEPLQAAQNGGSQDTPLFELSETDKATFTERWKGEVEQAVARGIIVPTSVLEQFKGEDWADEELALRDAVMNDPELWHMAEDSDDPDELREKLKYALVDDQELADNPLYTPEEVQEHKQQRELLEQALVSLDPNSTRKGVLSWVERLFEYAHSLTPQEEDERFLREYASGKEGVLKLKEKIGKGYQTPVLSKRVHSKTGDKTYYGMQNHWPAYKGISYKVLHLSENATDAQVQEAINKIKENPRRYREVLDFVQANNNYAYSVMIGMGRGTDEAWTYYNLGRVGAEVEEDLKKMEESGKKAVSQLSEEEKATPADQAEQVAGTVADNETPATLSQQKESADKQAQEAKAKAADAKAKLDAEEREGEKLAESIAKKKKETEKFVEQTNKELARKERKSKQRMAANEYRNKYLSLLRKLWASNEKADADAKSNEWRLDFLRQYGKEKASELEKTEANLAQEQLDARLELADTVKRMTQHADFLKAYGEEKAKQVSMKQTEIWNLEKELDDRRKRVLVLRRELTEANENVRKLTSHSLALANQLSALRVRVAVRSLIASIKRLGNPTASIDANIYGALSIVRQLSGSRLAVENGTAIESDADNYRANGVSQIEFYLSQTDHPEVADLIRERVRLNHWTVGQLMALRDAIRAMRSDAKESLARRQAETRMRRQSVLAGYFKELTGQDAPVYAMTDSRGRVNPKGGQLDAFAMREEVLRSIPDADRTDNAVKKFWNSFRGVWAKMQRIARILDGDKEGVLYDLLVRQAYFANTAQIRNVNARLDRGREAMARFGLTADKLDEKLYTYDRGATQITLTRGEVIGLYVYSQNEIESKKLFRADGNGISPEQAAEAISMLSEGDKAWGDWMIDDFARNRSRIAQAYYEQFNKELGNRDRYFPMIGDGTAVGVGEEDTLAGPTAIAKEKQRTRVNRSFTEETNENAFYPLQLNVTGSWVSQVTKEEHFLAWNRWVQDSQFLLGPNGGLFSMIRQKYGQSMAIAVQEYVNDMAYTFNQMSDFERMLNSFLSHNAVGSLAYNLVTAAKQAPSAAASIGNTSVANWMKAGSLLASSKRGETLDYIFSKAPDIAKRYVDLDIMRTKGRKTKVGKFLDNAAKGDRPWQGMWLTNAVDRSVVAQMWLAAYWTNLEDGMEEQEAVFKASQLIAETQPTSQPTDLSYAQRKWRDPIRRAVIMFTNQTFQLWNMATIDLPMYLRMREFGRIAPVLANIACNAAAMTLISGVWLPKNGDDDDGEKQRKRIVREMLANLATTFVPLAGGTVAEGIRGFMGSGDSIASKAGRMMRMTAEGKLRMKDVVGMAKDLGSNFIGTPTNAINRTTKAVTSGEILYLFGNDWGEWQESLDR